MPKFAIESNGRIEKTAIYYNGDQLSGVREIFLNMGEDGTFDAVIQYQGTDDQLHSKQIFVDYLENVKTMSPSFTEEEAQQLQLLSVESSGEIENTVVTINDQPLDGITSLLLHIKAPVKNDSGGLRSLFEAKKIPEYTDFKAEMTFRNEDGSLSTENIF